MKFLAAFISVLLAVFTATAQSAGDASQAESEGRQLARQIMEQAPTQDFTNTGVLLVRGGQDGRTEIPITCKAIVTTTNWQSIYYIGTNESNITGGSLTVTHSDDMPNQYRLDNANLSGDQTMVPFAGSDFWVADLGLEFFHWPDQKITKHETRRTRACAVLESTNPFPAPGAYSRVDSWIDNETLGIVHAEAHDVNGQLLKVFDPKSFKKVNGQWELQDIEIRNVQTHSRAWIKFDLNANHN